MCLKFRIIGRNYAAETDEPGMRFQFGRSKLRRIIKSTRGTRVLIAGSEMSAAHNAVSITKVGVGYPISRVRLIESVDPFHNIARHVLHSISACAIAVCSDGSGTLRTKIGATRFEAVPPGPHTLRSLAWPPGSSLFPFFLFWQ